MRVSALVQSRQTVASLVRELNTKDTPDVCLHFNVINWRTIKPSRDGRLHAVCACGTAVSRSAFVKESR